MAGPKLRGYTRVSTILNNIDDQGGIPIWRQRKAMEGFVARDDLWAKASAAVIAGNARELDAVVAEAIEQGRASEGANIGTSIHSFFEEVVRQGDEALAAIPQPWGAHVRAVFDALGAAGISVLECERILFIPELDDVVGTMDHRLLLPDGRQVVGDLKTGNLAYLFKPKLSAQLASYAHATRVYVGGEPEFDGYGRYRLPDPSTKSWADIEPIDQEVGLVTHLDKDSGAVQLRYVDLVKGWEFARIARQIYDLKKVTIGSSMTAPDPGALSPAPAGRKRRPSVLERAHPTKPPLTRAGLRDQVRQYLGCEDRDRAATFEHHLRLLWPDGVPTLASTHEHTPSELVIIDQAVVKAAAEAEMPFL